MRWWPSDEPGLQWDVGTNRKGGAVTGKRKLTLGISAGAVVVIVVGLLVALADGAPKYDAEFYNVSQDLKRRPYSDASYVAVLGRYVDDRGMVYYKGLKQDRAKLDDYARVLAFVPAKAYDAWSKNDKIAFWINAYNALTLKAIVDHYPIRSTWAGRRLHPANSIRQISGAWDKLQFQVMGRKMTLDHIEHQMLREKDKPPADKTFNEPRIHVALVCAAMGCPPLRNEPYVGKRLDRQLTHQAARFLVDPEKFRLDRPGGQVHLSKIFQWFGGDFRVQHPHAGFGDRSEDERASLHFVFHYLPRDDAAWLQAGKYDVKYLDYDWSLNERTAPVPPKPAASGPAKR